MKWGMFDTYSAMSDVWVWSASNDLLAVAAYNIYAYRRHSYCNSFTEVA